MLGIKVPKGEKVWVSYLTSDKRPKYIITSKPSKDYYYLYEVGSGSVISKIGRAKTPSELEHKYSILQNLQ